MNLKVGGSSPPQIEIFPVSKKFALSQERVSKRNAVAREQLTFHINLKISISPEPVFKNMKKQISGPDFESPSGRDISCPKNVDSQERNCDDRVVFCMHSRTVS